MAGFDGPNLEPLFNLVLVTLLVSVPLALWKLFEVIVFLFTHVSISVG